MLFIIIATFFAVISVLAVLNEWRKLNRQLFSSAIISTLKMSALFQSVWPTDPWFLSIVFSIFRHWLVCIISIFIITSSHVFWLFLLLSIPNFAYVYLKQPINKARALEWKEIQREDTEFLYINAKKACDYAKYFIYFSYVAFVASYIFY